MTIIPLKDRKSRIDDISKMILPEMAPEQLRLLGVSVKDIAEGNLHDAFANNAAGIEVIKLIHHRSNAIKHNQNDLYAIRSRPEALSQLNLVINNCDIFMKLGQKLLSELPPNTPMSESIYELIDKLVTTSVQIGYSAGSNDTCALLDRYTNSGHKATISTPKNAGDAKAKISLQVGVLVADMAKYVYQHKDLKSAPKTLLAEAIQTRLLSFTMQGNNKNIPALQQYANRCPAYSSINNWIKPVAKPKNSNKLPKPSLDKVINELTVAFKDQAIKRTLSQ
ncbi:hypothetical protein [Shewanella gaetbuli]|uniref:Uncharacterized protein n=1 Tax=Shewanella gaetbuli TaxID=220752 RepID=A0A9X1ZL36_9GAMM|nr:hypothetical protein [Shewanella gaetbuli]MCL1143708.1 hypothetical protein [Shewanella gaetbuli]